MQQILNTLNVFCNIKHFQCAALEHICSSWNTFWTQGRVLNLNTKTRQSDATDIERKDGFNPLAVFNLKHQACKIEHM